MIGIGIGIPRYYNLGGGVPPGPTYDVDYAAILNYATTQGYTLPSAGQQALQNQLVVDLKAAGIWSKLDTFAVFATDAEDSPESGTSNFALIDWKRLMQYTAVNSPTFTTDGGFTGNGTSSYIDTNFNPTIGTNNYLLNDAGRFFWVDNRTGVQWEGVSSGGINDSRNATSNLIRINSQALNSSVAFNVDEFHALNKTSSTTIELFTNTTQYSRTSTSPLNLANSNQFILRAGGTYNASRFRMYAMGGNLAAENTDFYNALNTYISAL